MTNHEETAREIVAHILEVPLDHPELDQEWAGDIRYVAAALDQARAEGGSCDEAHTPDEYEQEYQIVKAERDALKAEVARLKETRNLADGLNDTKPRGHTQQEP